MDQLGVVRQRMVGVPLDVPRQAMAPPNEQLPTTPLLAHCIWLIWGLCVWGTQNGRLWRLDPARDPVACLKKFKILYFLNFYIFKFFILKAGGGGRGSPTHPPRAYLSGGGLCPLSVASEQTNSSLLTTEDDRTGGSIRQKGR